MPAGGPQPQCCPASWRTAAHAGVDGPVSFLRSCSLPPMAQLSTRSLGDKASIHLTPPWPAARSPCVSPPGGGPTRSWRTRAAWRGLSGHPGVHDAGGAAGDQRGAHRDDEPAGGQVHVDTLGRRYNRTPGSLYSGLCSPSRGLQLLCRASTRRGQSLRRSR